MEGKRSELSSNLMESKKANNIFLVKSTRIMTKIIFLNILYIGEVIIK
jgi:hypothetical protein